MWHSKCLKIGLLRATRGNRVQDGRQNSTVNVFVRCFLSGFIKIWKIVKESGGAITYHYQYNV